MDLLQDENLRACGTDKEWTNLVANRGGLWQVKGTIYQLFCAIEYQIRKLQECF